jgi:hypothetical protein
VYFAENFINSNENFASLELVQLAERKINHFSLMRKKWGKAYQSVLICTGI